MFKMNENREFAKINIEYDSNLKIQKIAEVEGDEATIASLLGSLIYKLIDSGFDRELLEYAVAKALKDSKKKTSKIEIKEILIKGEQAKEFKEYLDNLLKGDK